MIPSGYKEDIVYSQIPTDGSGDLSFTRASNGTRVNSAGLVEVCPWNLCTYSEQFQNADWLGGGNGKPTMTDNFAEAPNGTMTASKMEAASDGYQLRQNNAQENTQMNLSVWLRTNTGTKTIQLFMNNASTASQNITVTTTWTRYEISGLVTTLAGSGRNGLNTLEALTSSNYILVWGFQLSVGLTAKPYFPTTDRLNVPRLTYQNGGGGCPSLLLEKQSTNLCLWSEDFTQSVWSLPFLVRNATANTATSPDGTQNADTLADSITTAEFGAGQLITATNNIPQTVSVYLKANGSNFAMLRFYGNNIQYYYCVVVDLSTGTITKTQAGTSTSAVSSTITAMGNGWYRVTATATMNTLDYYLIANLVPSATPTIGDFGNSSYTGTGNNSIYVYGAQLEASSYATSYISTTSSSATRVADECRKSSISSLIGQTEGVLFADVNLTTRQSFTYISISNGGSSANYIGIYFRAAAIEMEVVNGGVLQGNVQYSNTSTGRFKIAIGYKQNDFVLYVNGTQIGTDTSGTIPTCDRLDLFAFNDNQPLQVNETILFPTRLTNAELASLTTI